MDQPTTPRQITLDQVVAYNLRRARKLRDWTQTQAAEQLEPYLGERWSSAVFSAAERSYEGPRVREFSASQVLALALGFDLPITWFFQPPTPDTQVTARGSEHAISGEALVKLLVDAGAADEWERTLELVYALAMQVAGSGSPDFDLIGRVLSNSRLTIEQKDGLFKVYKALEPRRKANYDALEGKE